MNRTIGIIIAFAFIGEGVWLYISREQTLVIPEQPVVQEASSTVSTDASPATTSTPVAIPSAPSPVASVIFECDGNKSINATFYTGESKPVMEGEMPQPTGSVELTFSDGARVTLLQTISADGARYANADESMVFWNKGSGAFVMHNDQIDTAYTNCSTTD
jgi:membrane-bound inhibitor of C-type lysozyme